MAARFFGNTRNVLEKEHFGQGAKARFLCFVLGCLTGVNIPLAPFADALPTLKGEFPS